jgi:hypothetical protein
MMFFSQPVGIYRRNKFTPNPLAQEAHIAPRSSTGCHQLGEPNLWFMPMVHSGCQTQLALLKS